MTKYVYMLTVILLLFLLISYVIVFYYYYHYYLKTFLDLIFDFINLCESLLFFHLTLLLL